MLFLVGIAQFTIAKEIDESDSRFIEIRDITVIPYFEALKKGDVTSLHTFLSVQRYEINRTLIEQNELYPYELRKHFQGAMFELIWVSQDDKKVTVLVKIYWPDGQIVYATLDLIEDGNYSSKNTLRWKIDRD